MSSPFRGAVIITPATGQGHKSTQKDSNQNIVTPPRLEEAHASVQTTQSQTKVSEYQIRRDETQQPSPREATLHNSLPLDDGLRSADRTELQQAELGAAGVPGKRWATDGGTSGRSCGPTL